MPMSVENAFAIGVSSAARAALLTPIAKAFSTDIANEVTSLNVQVHGGMGFIEETGAAQHYRDARILTIYEGTTAIQANDFVGRKTVRDGGALARAFAQEIAAVEALLRQRGSEAAQAMALRLSVAREAFLEVVGWIVANVRSDPNAVFAGSVPYLMLAGNLAAGWQMGRALLAAEDRLAAGDDPVFMRRKITVARFYADHILTRVPGLRDSIVAGSEAIVEMALEDF